MQDTRSAGNASVPSNQIHPFFIYTTLLANDSGTIYLRLIFLLR